VVFSDTLIAWSKSDAKSGQERAYIVMYLCEFVQDLKHRLVGLRAPYRAVIVPGQGFVFRKLSKIDYYYGAPLIEAHRAEKEIPSLGLFIHKDCQHYNTIFPVEQFSASFDHVFIDQSLEQANRDTGGRLPVHRFTLEGTGSYCFLLTEIYNLREIYRGAYDFNLPPLVRVKYATAWQIYLNRYPELLTQLVQSNFDLATVCPGHDWTKDRARFLEDHQCAFDEGSKGTAPSARSAAEQAVAADGGAAEGSQPARRPTRRHRRR
jgi:hypothetical protein